MTGHDLLDELRQMDAAERIALRAEVDRLRERVRELEAKMPAGENETTHDAPDASRETRRPAA